jgi:hypothetical protein
MVRAVPWLAARGEMVVILMLDWANERVLKQQAQTTIKKDRRNEASKEKIDMVEMKFTGGKELNIHKSDYGVIMSSGYNSNQYSK